MTNNKPGKLASHHQEICSAYIAGQSEKQIASCYGVANNAIHQVLLKNKVARRGRGGVLSLTKEEADAAVVLYAGGLSALGVAKKMGRGVRAVRHSLRKLGQPIKNRSEARRLYKLNQFAFSEITDSSAYWIGFLMADGCVEHPEGDAPVLTVSLKESDAEHISKLIAFLGSDREVEFLVRASGFGTRKKRGMCRARFSSHHLAADLALHGVVPRKTGSEKASDALRFNRHFWRGIIDGDGTVMLAKSVSKYNPLKPVLRLGCASRDLIVQFLDFVRTICPACRASPSSILPVGGTMLSHGCSLAHRMASQVIAELYQAGDVALDRKMASAMQVAEVTKKWLNGCAERHKK